MTPYTLPSPNATPPGAQFAGLQIAAGLDGNLWFTHANNVGAVAPDGTITDLSSKP